VGNTERKIPLEKPRRRWQDNIKMDAREIKWVGMIELIWLWVGTS
jgi:hypothetical protein